MKFEHLRTTTQGDEEGEEEGEDSYRIGSSGRNGKRATTNANSVVIPSARIENSKSIGKAVAASPPALESIYCVSEHNESDKRDGLFSKQG